MPRQADPQRNEAMHRLRLVSAIGWGFPTWDEDEAAGLLTQLGIGYVQLFRNAQKEIPARDVRLRLADHGLAAASLHAFFGQKKGVLIAMMSPS